MNLLYHNLESNYFWLFFLYVVYCINSSQHIENIRINQFLYDDMYKKISQIIIYIFTLV